VTPRLRWVLAIVALLVANLVAMVILAVTSSMHDPEVIPMYYEEMR